MSATRRIWWRSLQGIGEATGLSLAELVVVGGFTDFIDTVYNLKATTSPVPAHAGADNCTALSGSR